MGPFKCPECGIWWAGFEHRCALPLPATVTVGVPYVQPWINEGTSTTTVVCTCPLNRGDNYLGHCPIHDVHVTYTS